MSYYDALVAEWQALTSTTTDAKLAEINALTVAGPRKPVPIVDVTHYLRSNNLWLQIKGAAAQGVGSAIAAVDYNDDRRAQTLDFDLPIVQAMLADLVANKLLTQEQSDALVALGNTTQPWWMANGYQRPINKGDVVVAGLDDATGYSVSFGPVNVAQLNVSISVTVTGPNGAETIPTFANTADADYSKFFAANCIQNMMTRDASLATFG
jgi:hypothetical protein